MWSDCLLDLGTISLIGSIWSLYEMRSILRQHLISMVCILLWSSAVRVHDSLAYRKMAVTRERHWICSVLSTAQDHVRTTTSNTEYP